jgi:glutathione peroxidase
MERHHGKYGEASQAVDFATIIHELCPLASEHYRRQPKAEPPMVESTMPAGLMDRKNRRRQRAMAAAATRHRRRDTAVLGESNGGALSLAGRITMTTLYEIPVRTLAGRETTLAPFAGQVLLIVNVASKCGFTPQYEGLEALHREYGARGLAVLGFPCNQFGEQEPGNAEEIATFCSTTYDVSFPMFEKVDVNGPNAHPLYQLLKGEAPGILGSEAIKWNFTKFLVSRTGDVASRHAPSATPTSLRGEIETLLG